MQVEFHNCIVQDYHHNDTEVDLIFISHVMYYCYDQYFDIVKKAISWLKPHGMMIIMHVLEDEFTKFFGK